MTASTDDFFRSRLDHMIDLRHPLAVLASRMPWQEIEASLAPKKHFPKLDPNSFKLNLIGTNYFAIILYTFSPSNFQDTKHIN